MGLLAGTAGVLRGIGGIAGDFLGGGAQFVDGCGHAIGAHALFFGADDRRVGGVDHFFRQVMHQASRRRHLADRGVDALDETVERGGQFAELVLVLYHEAAGQVAFAFGDVAHGAAHGGQWAHQHRNQQAQQAGDGGHGDEHGDDRRGAELAEGGVGLVLVDRQADVPLGRRQAGDRGEGEDALFAVEGHVLHAGFDLQVAARVDVLEVLHHVSLVRADDHLAIAVDQERMADTAEVHGVEDFDQGVEAQVATDHAQQFTAALALDRDGDGHHQAAHRGLVGRGQQGLVGAHGGAVPRALTRVIAVGHPGVGALGEQAGVLAKIGELEIAGVGRLVDQARHVVAGALLGDVLGQVFQHQDASAHPVLHAAGGLRAGLAYRGLDVLADRVALQVVVVEGKQREGQDDHAAGAEQDLVAKFQVHVSRPWANGGRAPHACGVHDGACPHGYRPSLKNIERPSVAWHGVNGLKLRQATSFGAAAQPISRALRGPCGSRLAGEGARSGPNAARNR
ncbi:hypothetical protein D3C76_621100 [compost metagenome]